MMPTIANAYTPYYTAILDSVATIYANNFTVSELQEIEAFYRLPAGQKLLAKLPSITQQSQQGRNWRRSRWISGRLCV